MKTVLRLEEIGIFILSVYLFSRLDFVWWWFPLLLLTPDIGMLGYLFNPKIGAFMYNLLHHRLVAAIVGMIGLSLANPYWQLAAVILFAHISLDRIFGFGLKYTSGFKNTHLNEVK